MLPCKRAYQKGKFPYIGIPAENLDRYKHSELRAACTAAVCIAACTDPDPAEDGDNSLVFLCFHTALYRNRTQTN